MHDLVTVLKALIAIDVFRNTELSCAISMGGQLSRRLSLTDLRGWSVPKA